MASAAENTYTFAIDLPGRWWISVCTDPHIMAPLMETIEYRCLQAWRSGRRRFKESLVAAIEEDRCRIRFEVMTTSKHDRLFPKYVDDCILSPMPLQCGGVADLLPWPSKCFPIKASLHAGTILAAVCARPLTSAQWLTLELKTVGGTPWKAPQPGSDRAYAKYTPEQTQLILELRESKALKWSEIAEYFPGRTTSALVARYRLAVYEKRKGVKPQAFNYTPMEDRLLIELVELKGLSWTEIAEQFPGRAKEALHYHYSTELKGGHAW